MTNATRTGSTTDQVRRCTALTLLVLGAVLLVGCAKERPLMPTPNLYADAGQNPFEAVVPALQHGHVDLLYVTDRGPEESQDTMTEYGYQRSGSIAFGSCVVDIGGDADWEDLVRNSLVHERDMKLNLELHSINEMVRFNPTPGPLVEGPDGRPMRDPKDLEANTNKAAEFFFPELRRRLELTPRREVFMFIHGFHNTFDDAAYLMAELWHFMGREGVPLIYTWPAGHPGMLRGYNYDRESGEFTIFHLKQCLRALAMCEEVERINVLCHSRGTDVFLSALRELVIAENAAGRDPQESLKFGKVIIAAADLDMQVVSQRLGAEMTLNGVHHATLYVSSTDKAIGISRWLFASLHRVGRMDYGDLSESAKQRMAIARNFDIVDAKVNTGFVGHGYFHSNPSVSSDLILFWRDGLEAGAEHGRPLTQVAPHFWEVRDGYPTVTHTTTERDESSDYD
jgi:esterase/lipase superfamily enzyme